MSFPRYPAYKPSGVEWLGNVPSEWKVRPLKSIACVINGFPFDSKSFDPNEGFPLVRIRDLNQSSPDTRYKGEFVDSAAISNDDVLIGMDGGFNVGRWLGEVPALLNQRMCCVRTDTPMITRYLQYVLPAPLDAINKLTYATTVKHLSSFDVLKIRLAMPPDESRIAEIVSFLDHETAKIDALIAEQQRLIELLQEKRQAVISHAVTKGLNPNAPMKDSGVEWLGEVPEHWDVCRVKAVSVFTTSGPRGLSERVGDVGALFVQSGDLTDVMDVDFANCKRVQVGDDAEAARTKLVDGDLVVCITGAKTGNVAMCESVPESSYVNQHLCLIRPGEGVHPRFLAALLKSGSGQTYFSLAQYGLKQGLSLEDVREAPVTLPPLDEQDRICQWLRGVSSRYLPLEAESQRTISLLQERRSALISAAVTGQIDVRGLVPEAVAV